MCYCCAHWSRLLYNPVTFIPLLLLAGMESVTIIFDTSSSSIVASVISDDKNVTSFGSLEKFLHLKHNTNAMYKIPECQWARLAYSSTMLLIASLVSPQLRWRYTDSNCRDYLVKFRNTHEIATWILKLFGNKLLAVNIQAFAPDTSCCAKRDLQVATNHSQSLSLSVALFVVIPKVYVSLTWLDPLPRRAFRVYWFHN